MKTFLRNYQRYLLWKKSPSSPLPLYPVLEKHLSPSGSLLIVDFNCPSLGSPFTGESLNKPDRRSQHWIIWVNELINISHLQAVGRRTMSLDRLGSKGSSSKTCALANYNEDKKCRISLIISDNLCCVSSSIIHNVSLIYWWVDVEKLM